MNDSTANRVPREIDWIFRETARVLCALLVIWGLLTLVPSLTSTTYAQVSDGEKALARKLFQEGVAAAEAKKWEKARESFERAYEILPRGSILLNLAGAQVKTGHLVEGAESFRKYLRDGGKLEEAAKAELEKVENQIPRVRLSADVGVDDQLFLDSSRLRRAVLGEELPINPGKHTWRVKRNGVSIASDTFTIRKGESKDIELVAPALSPEDVAQDYVGNGEGEEYLPTEPEKPRSKSKAGLIVGITVAVLAVAAAVILVVLLTRGGIYDQGNLGTEPIL